MNHRPRHWRGTSTSLSSSTCVAFLLTYSDIRAATASLRDVASYRPSNQHPLRRHADIVTFRGGGTFDKDLGQSHESSDDDEEEDDEEEKARLDAYIEDLIANVDDSNTGESSTADHDDDSHELSASLVDTSSNPGKSKKKKKSERERATSLAPSLKEATKNSQQRKDQNETDLDSVKPQSLEDSMSDEDKQNELQSTSNDTEKPEKERAETTETTEQQTSATMAMPNPLFRFLLNRGRIGHVIIMIMALVLDWLAIYLPLVSSSMDWVYCRVVPKRMREPPRRRGGRNGRGGPVPPTAVTATMARTGASKKKQRVMIQEADKVALQQLKSLDSNSRYIHVSENFMKRHLLGPHRSGDEMNELNEVEDESASTPIDDSSDTKSLTVGSRSVKKGRRRKKPSVDSSNEPDDWVVRALTTDRGRSGRASSTGSSKVRPTISFELGSGGIGVSLGLETGTARTATRDKYRQSVTLAVTQQKPAPRVSKRGTKPAGERTSDASSGFMGKIRASGLSRSLLGAYPGDAAPVEAAADSGGLLGLAKRYGYEDRASSTINEEDEFYGGFGGFNDESSSRKRRKRRRKTSSDDDSDVDRDEIAGISLRGRRASIDKSSLDSVLSTRKTSVRPALERLSEVKSRRKTESKNHLSSTSEVKKSIPRSTVGNARALERIKEVRRRNGESDH